MSDYDAELDAFQERLGHRFRDPGLLVLALTHPSLQQEEPGIPHNQRLEFLGDAVLQLALTERLHAMFPDDREGSLTKRRATLARGACLTELARELGVARVLRVSGPERTAGGHERPTALEDAVEALVAAVYLDCGWETTRAVVMNWYGDLHARLNAFEQAINPKGTLQELIQPTHGNAALSYRVVGMEGPPHERRFEVEVMLQDEVLGRGFGSSKKEAEEAAASAALRRWEADGI